MTNQQQANNIISDAILEAIRPLIAAQVELDTAETLLRAAHDLYTCPECERRPCGCELPFGYLEDLE